MKEIDKIKAIDRYISHLQFEANQIEGLLRVTNDKWIVNAIPRMLSHLKAGELKAHKKMKELIEAKGDDDEFKVKLEFQRKNQSVFMQMQKEEGLKLMCHVVRFPTSSRDSKWILWTVIVGKEV